MATLDLKRELILREYQTPVSNYVMEHDISVLGLAPGAGKTEVSIDVISRFLNLYPSAKILVSAASTIALKRNFFDRVNDIDVNFTYSTNLSDDSQVHICLPQNRNYITKKYDLLIVDEAHTYYFAKTVQSIIKKIQPKKQVLLTGSPSIFIKKGGYNIFFLALNQLPIEFFAKLNVELVATKAYWKNNYNADLVLKKEYEMTNKEVKHSIDAVVKSLTERLKTKISATDFNMKNWKHFLYTSKVGDLFHKIEKTLFFCKSISHANKVYYCLKNQGVNCELSHSENDIKSLFVSSFLNNEFDVLIVVDRARLGYSDNNLFNIVDMSGTHNPDMIYQILSRVVRGTPDMQKFYLKLTTTEPGMMDYTHACTCAALMLTDHKYLSMFNGDNFNGIIVPVIKNKKSSSSRGTGSSNKSKKQKLVFPEFTNDVVDMFKDIALNLNTPASIYKTTTLGEVKAVLFSKYNTYSKEDIFELAKNYTGTNFANDHRDEYRFAERTLFIKELRNILDKDKVTIDKRKEEILKIYSEYNGSNFRADYGAEYCYADSHDFLNEMYLLKGKAPKKRITIEERKKEVLNKAKNFKGTIVEFKQKYEADTLHASRNKYLSELNNLFTSH
jgi:superfamily II DNA or RNA helicase